MSFTIVSSIQLHPHYHKRTICMYIYYELWWKMSRDTDAIRTEHIFHVLVRVCACVCMHCTVVLNVGCVTELSIIARIKCILVYIRILSFERQCSLCILNIIMLFGFLVRCYYTFFTFVPQGWLLDKNGTRKVCTHLSHMIL